MSRAERASEYIEACGLKNVYRKLVKSAFFESEIIINYEIVCVKDDVTCLLESISLGFLRRVSRLEKKKNIETGKQVDKDHDGS